MNTLLSFLAQEHLRLVQIQQEIIKSLKNAPVGTLKLSYSHGSPQFYFRAKPGEKEKYIRKTNRRLAAQLAQKKYDECIFPLIQTELSLVEQLIAHLEERRELEVYLHFPEPVQRLIQPTALTDAEFLAQWESESYAGLPFVGEDYEIYTDRGERVRSKSEKIIADKLNSLHIPYRYEQPLLLEKFGTVYPDFHVLNVHTRKDYYWEHFGMMGNEEYCSNALRKIDSYMRNGWFPGDRLIFTFESERKPLDSRIVEQIVRKYLS